MKTTELFVEQIVIGSLVLMVIVLFAAGDLVVNPFAPEPTASALTFNLVNSVVLLGLVYLLGIVYDRLADTLLQDLEQHNRLLFTLDGLEKKSKPGSVEDPFPEEKFRMKVLGDDGAADYANYL